MTMAKLKPYHISRTHFLLSIPNHPLPFPISKININSRRHDPTSLRISQPHRTHQPIVCARRRGWSQPSNQKMLQLASTVAFNLRILPEPLNSLAGEIARGDSNTIRPVLNRVVGFWRGKITRRRRREGKNFAWFVFALICVSGWWSWKVAEVDLFLKAVLCCVAGFSLIRLWKGKKAIKEWFLGFLFGIVLVIGSGLGKRDVKFWVKKLMTGSPVAQFAIRKRNRYGRMSK